MAFAKQWALYWFKKHPEHERVLPLDDVGQLALLGMCEAATKYDPSRKTSFKGYSSHWMHRAVQRYLARTVNLIRWPDNDYLDIWFRNLHGKNGLPPGKKMVVPLEEDIPEPEKEELAKSWELVEAVATLDGRERDVINFLFFANAGYRDYRLREVGRILGISGEYVRLIKNSALRKMRKLLEEA